jgi:hypothetical protein
MTTLIKRTVMSIPVLMLLLWVLLKLLPAALPFLIALWVIATLVQAVNVKRKW